MGQSYSPEELKEMVRKDPKFIPDELVPKQVYEGMQLRNRLTPRSVTSIPAILSSDSSYISDVFRVRGNEWSDSEDDDDGGSSDMAPLILPSPSIHRSVSQRADSPQKSPAKRTKLQSSQPVDIDEISPVYGAGKASHTMFTTKHDVTAEVYGSPKVGQSPNLRQPEAETSNESPDSFQSAISDMGSKTSMSPQQRGDGSMSESRRAFLEGILAMDADDLNRSFEREYLAKKPSPAKRLKRWVKTTLVAPIKDKISSVASSFRREESVVEEVVRSPPLIQTPISIVYEAPARPKRRQQKVHFEQIPVIRPQRTRAGRETRVPSKFKDYV
jgi:hypothetical protein